MSLIETESIVLKTHNLADADKIVVLLTHDHGVVRGVAKGVKRLKSRFGSGLEPFSIVRATYFEKEAVELVSIQNIDLIESFFAAASNPDFLQKFSYLSDLLITFSPPHDPNENLYRMVRACIKAAAEDDASYLAISVYFESWILRLAGFMPDWQHCDQCSRVIEDNETAEIRSNFHLICSDCRRPSGSRAVDSVHRAIFTGVRRLSPIEFVKFTNGDAERLAMLSGIFKRIISHSIGHEIRGEVSLGIGN